MKRGRRSDRAQGSNRSARGGGGRASRDGSGPRGGRGDGASLRERVIGALGGRGSRARAGRGRAARDLERRLGAEGRREQRELAGLLHQLVRDGAVERVARRYRLPRKDGLVEGVFGTGPDGMPFVRSDGGQLFAVGDAADAEPGDRVLAVASGPPMSDDAAPTARADVLEVRDARRREWIGVVNRDFQGAIVTPYRDDHDWGIRIARDALDGAEEGEVVRVRPLRRRKRQAGLAGRVVERLGRPGDAEADYQAIVWHKRLPTRFPDDVLAEAEAVSGRGDAGDPDRRDLVDMPFVTIDPITARDHDDAVCVQRLSGGGHRLWVAIADVSHFVPEGSALDREALRRGNSVYFPDRAIPMLPERLSSDLCSLREGVDRPAMVAELRVDAQGAIVGSEFYSARIRSRAKLHYEQAASILDGTPADGLDAETLASLRELGDLAETLRARRFGQGSIDFDLPSAEIVLGAERRPVDIVEAPRTPAHRAIEEAMLAANQAVAIWLEAQGVPTVYRIHEPPSPGDAEELRKLLEAFGLLEARPRGRDAVREAREVARAVQRAVGRPEERLIHTSALRSMQQARYSKQNQGHFALAFEHYLHFTSPIRRYADLVVHRALKDRLAGRDEAAERRGEILGGVASRISWRERLAMEAERDAVDLKKCAFMMGRVGERYPGTLTGVARHGFYVTLDPFFVEGLVHVSTLDDYVELDEQAHALVGRRSGERFELGDRFEVSVDTVDPIKAWINFSVVERLPRAEAEG